MVGRQVIVTKRAFTLEELESFLKERWDRVEYGDFIIDRPTPGSIEEYILLRATDNFMVILYSRPAGFMFSKKNKVILAVCETPAGARKRFTTMVNTGNIFVGAAQLNTTFTLEKERKGPAEDALRERL